MDRATRVVVVAGGFTVALLLLAAGCIIANIPRPPAERRRPAGWSAGLRPAAMIPTPLPAPRRPRPRLRYLNVRYAPLIEQAAERHDVPPLLIAAITRVESDFDPNELSHKGARGLMQVMPETGARFGVPPSLLFDPERNIAAGTAYLSWLLDRYDNDLDLALAGYNAGEGAVDKYSGIPPYRETRNYVRKVRSAFYELQRTN